MATWGKYRSDGISHTQLVWTQMGSQRTSYLTPVALTESGGATPDVALSGRSSAYFAGNSTNRLTSATTVSPSTSGNSWFVICRFTWNSFWMLNNTCRIVGIGTSSIQAVAGNVSISFLNDAGTPVNRQGGTLVTGENVVIVHCDVAASLLYFYLNGTLVGSNAWAGTFANARSIVFGDSAANSRGDFNVLELAIGDGASSLAVLDSTKRATVTAATEFLDVAPLGHATGGTSTNELTFASAILGGRTLAAYSISLYKASPKPASGYSLVGISAARTGPGAFSVVDPAASDLSYYRATVTSTVPGAEQFSTSNYTTKFDFHEAGNPYPGAAPTPQGVPALGSFPLTSGMPRAIHGLGDSRFPVNDFKTISAALTGRTTAQVHAVSRSGSNWRHWQLGNTTYPPGIDIYQEFRNSMAAVGAQGGDWVAVMIDVNALEAVDAIGAGGYTDAVRNVLSQIVADGWIPKVVLDPLSAAFKTSTFDNYQGHQAVIAAAVANAGGGAQYMTAGNVRRQYNSMMPQLTTDRTHWDVAGASTILARMIGADLLSLVSLEPGTIGQPLGQTGVSSWYVTSISGATGGGVLAYQWQDFAGGTWANIIGATLIGNFVCTGIRAGSTKLRRAVSNGTETKYSNELDIVLPTAGGVSVRPGVPYRRLGFGL